MKRFPFIACLFVLFLSANLLYSADDCKIKRTITVSGSSEFNISPNIAKFTIFLGYSDKNKAEARGRIRNNVKQALQTLKKYGVLDKHIQTGYNNVYPIYIKRKEKEDKIKEYKAMYIVYVELRNLQVIDSIKNEITRIGGASFSSMEFLTSESRKYQDSARKEAVRAAKEKADAMVGVLGMKVGKAITITLNNNSVSMFDSPSSLSNTIVNVDNNTSKNKQFEIADTDEDDSENIDDNITEIGQITLKENVNIVFEIE